MKVQQRADAFFETTMEDQYNKKENKGSLIGNWVEERALQETTGIFRYQEWEDSIGEEGPKDDSVVTTRWTKGGEKADQNDTFNRCFSHMDHQEYGSMRSFTEHTYQNPAKTTGYREYRDVGAGTRSRMTQQEMWDLAAKQAEAQAEEENRNMMEEPLVSTVQESFQAPPEGAYTKPIGSRVMNTRDNRAIPNDTRDITFLVESGIRGPDTRLNYQDVGTLSEPTGPHHGDVYTSQAITFYSGAPGRGSSSFAGRAGTTKFGRGSQFSTPIEYSTQPEKE